jgi:iron complex outermembrane receptor protein
MRGDDLAICRLPAAAGQRLRLRRTRRAALRAGCAAALVAGLAFPGAVCAQTTTAAAEEAAGGEIIVTAQRRSQRLLDVPLSVQAQSGEDLQRAGITDTRMLEHVSPSVNFTSGQTRATSVSIRGIVSISNWSGIQPSVGVVVDGVPLARSIEFVSDLADIDRVEVLNGPQGTLFGKNSTAGVINIVSKKPTQDFSLETEGSYTTDDEVLLKGVVNVPLSERIAMRVNGYYRNLEPLIDNINPLARRGAYTRESWGLQGKLGIGIGQGDLVVTGNYNHAYDDFLTNMVIVPISPPLGTLQQAIGVPFGRGGREVNQDTSSYAKIRSWSLIAELNQPLTDDLQLTAITGYRQLRHVSEIDTDSGPTGVTVGRGAAPNPLGYPIETLQRGDNHLRDHHRYFSQEIRFAYARPGLDIVAGGFYQAYRERNSIANGFLFEGSYLGLPLGSPGYAAPGDKFYVDAPLTARSRNNTAAIFGDVTVEVVDKVKLFGGLRYTRETLSLDYARDNYFTPAAFFDVDSYTSALPPISTTAFKVKRKDNNVSGRVGVQWQPRTTTNFYASYSRGFKGAAADQSQSVVSAAVALLSPEKATAYELGAKVRLFDNRLALDAAIYKQTIDNVQQTVLKPNSIDNSFLNAGKLKVDGFEINARLNAMEGLNLRGGVVYNKARYGGTPGAADEPRYVCGPSATPGQGGCGLDGTQSLIGKQAIGAPRWKVVAGLAYEHDLPGPTTLTFGADYTWRSSIQYQLFEDPLSREPSTGLLDAQIGIRSDDDRWSAMLFGKNLTNNFYYSNLNIADFVIGRSFGNLPRDFRRYGGIRVTYKI